MGNEIQIILRELGIGYTYRGYRSAVIAVSLAVEDENRLDSIVNNIYMETAKQTGVKWTAVERNIKTVIQRAWRTNPARLCEISGYPLSKPPTVSEFIDMMYNYVVRYSGINR